MSDFDYQKLDDLIHSRIRLAIMALLVGIEEAEFTYIREKVQATDGNLSVHLSKLEEAKYLSVKKRFADKKPVTVYKITTTGRKAFEAYVDQLERLIPKSGR